MAHTSNVKLRRRRNVGRVDSCGVLKCRAFSTALPNVIIKPANVDGIALCYRMLRFPYIALISRW
jgi:hypothetical protein